MQNKIVLDYLKNISIDPTNSPLKNYQVVQQNIAGLHHLATIVRSFELEYIENDPYAKGVTFHLKSNAPGIIPCAFNWFSVTLTNHLRVIALVELMLHKGWSSQDLMVSGNHKEIKDYCKNYVSDAVPEIYAWRNKVAAHFAATDPYKDDSLATLEMSLMGLVSYHYPYYKFGSMTWNTDGTSSSLPEWSLTKKFEDLQIRYWPELELEKIPE